jgi:hypothetical protein
MAIVANFSTSQGTDCTVGTFTDETTGYPTPPTGTRSLDVTYPDGSSETIPFPYGDGAGDTVDITSLVKDYCLLVTMTITPAVVDPEDVLVVTKYPVFTCNTDACINDKATDLAIDLCNVPCSNPLLCNLSKIVVNKQAAKIKGQAGDQDTAQAYLDTNVAICTSNCNC